jgi:beta-lactamase regulating signal transducer with metallopeptidase domain
MLALSEEVFAALVRATLLVAVAAAMLWVVLRASRIRSPGVWRAASLAVLLVGWAFVPLSFELPWYAPQPQEIAGAGSSPENLDSADSDRLGSRPATIELPPQSVSETDPEAGMLPLELDAAQLSAAPDRIAQPRASTEPAAAAGPALDNRPDTASLRAVAAAALIVVWLAGMLAVVLRGVVASVRFVRDLSRSVPAAVPPEWQEEWVAVQSKAGVARTIPLRVTGEIGPLLCRLPGRYALLVPRQLWQRLDGEQRRAVLEHELAHYLRRDIWKSLAVRLLVLPHWFNPAAWWAVRRFDAAAEWACDARVCADRSSAVRYARALLALVEGQPEAAPVPALFSPAAQGRTLAERIRRVLSEPRR